MQVNVTAQQDSQLQSPTGPEITENRAHRRLQEVTGLQVGRLAPRAEGQLPVGP